MIYKYSLLTVRRFCTAVAAYWSTKKLETKSKYSVYRVVCFAPGCALTRDEMPRSIARSLHISKPTSSTYDYI